MPLTNDSLIIVSGAVSGGKQTMLDAPASASGNDVSFLGKINTADAINITGNSDVNQLTIQANATQTLPLILVNDDLGAELFRIHSNISSNLFAGNISGGIISTGINDTGYGDQALRFVISGDNNAGFGAESLGRVFITSNNTGCGAFSGTRNNAGSDASSISDCTCLGYDTRLLGSSDVNEIVIGSLSRGIGSNTVVLGNDSITQTRLKGKVELGVTANRMAMLGNTSSAADPTTTDLPTTKDMAIHKNTTTGNIFLAFNDAGTIKKVQLI